MIPQRIDPIGLSKHIQAFGRGPHEIGAMVMGRAAMPDNLFHEREACGDLWC